MKKKKINKMGICGSSSPDIAIVPNKFTINVDSENKQNPIPNANQSNISITGNNELEHEDMKS